MTDNEYNILLENSRPHQVFKLDWSSYYLKKFSDTFLPRAYTQNLTGINLKDVANIFENTPKSNEQLTLLNSKIKLSIFTYPKDALIARKKDLLKTDPEDLVIFIETDKNDNLTISSSLNSSLKKLLLKDDDKTLTDRQLTKTQFLKELNYEVRPLTLIEFITGNQLKTADLTNPASLRQLQQTFKEMEEEFGAGRVKDKHPEAFGHGDIEYIALKQVGFKEEEIDIIYYGNWLRDYSQIIVPETIGLIEKDYFYLNKKEEKNTNFNSLKPGISYLPLQETWSKILQILAVKEFIYNKLKDSNKTPSQDYEIHLENFIKKYGELTPDILGIYRPEEHLDNPKGIENYSFLGDTILKKPINFKYNLPENNYEFKTFYKGTLEKSLDYNQDRMLKNYLFKDYEDRPSSTTYFSQQLRLAYENGKTRQGFIHLGAALHVLEDYFAHSNFIELTLIKLGCTKVYPWVQIDKKIEKIKDGKIKSSKIPVVTGLFGLDDTLYSITPKISEEIFDINYEEYIALKPGEKTFFDSMVLTLLKDLSSREKNVPKNLRIEYLGLTFTDLLRGYNKYLKLRDNISSEQQADTVLGKIITFLQKNLNFIQQGIKFYSNIIFNITLNITDDAIKESQTRFNKNFGTNPTHGQLAKDPVDHPLNPLAGQLAIEAVKDVGREITKCWKEELAIDYLINYSLKKYFVHPKNTTWMDNKVEDWAKKNKQTIRKLENKTNIHYHEKQIKKELSKFQSFIKNL